MGPRFSRAAVLTAVAFFLWASGALAQTIVTNTSPASASGSITSTSSSSTGPAIYGLQGQTCTIDVIGTFTGTINVQGSTSWSNVPVSPVGSTSTQTGITAAGLYYESVASLSQIRVTGPTSTGSVNVFLYCVFNGSSGSSGSISGNVSATQSGTWNVGISGTPTFLLGGNTYQIITTSGLTTIKNPGPGVLMGVRNLSTSQQPAGECDIYDNTAASGTPIWTENGIYQDQQWNDNGGTIFLTALVINCATAPTVGLLVEFR